MATENKKLSAEIDFDIRFSEVDSMQIVWHGSYPLYFEDAREAFGRKYGLEYLYMFEQGFYAPLVDLRFKYKKPLVYGMTPRIRITLRPTSAAKLIFDYEIFDSASGEVYATGSSTQVFLDRDYQLMWTNPPFFEEWKAMYLNTK